MIVARPGSPVDKFSDVWYFLGHVWDGCDRQEKQIFGRGLWEVRSPLTTEGWNAAQPLVCPEGLVDWDAGWDNVLKVVGSSSRNPVIAVVLEWCMDRRKTGPEITYLSPEAYITETEQSL